MINVFHGGMYFIVCQGVNTLNTVYCIVFPTLYLEYTIYCIEYFEKHAVKYNYCLVNTEYYPY